LFQKSLWIGISSGLSSNGFIVVGNEILATNSNYRGFNGTINDFRFYYDSALKTD